MVIVINMQPDGGNKVRRSSLNIPWTVALVGDLDPKSAKVVHPTLEDVRASFEAVETVAKLVELQASRGNLQAVIVLADSFNGLPSIYRDLRNFRQKYPDVAILVLSSRLMNDDYTTDRGSILDVVLRLPITSGQMIGAMIQADINNRRWRENVE